MRPRDGELKPLDGWVADIFWGGMAGAGLVLPPWRDEHDAACLCEACVRARGGRP